jgi:ribonuclease HI
MKYIKFDIVTKNYEFIVEKDLKIPFKKKINDLKNNRFYYYGCLVPEDCYLDLFKNYKNKKSIVNIEEKKVNIKNMYHIYCDGAALNNGQKKKGKNVYGSYGYIILKQVSNNLFRIIDSSTKSRENWTNNYSELVGVLDALEKLLYICKDKNKISVNIISDSQYVTRGATTWVHNWIKNNWKNSFNKDVANEDLWRRFLELKNKKPNETKKIIRFKWTRGHNSKNSNSFDTLLNEECDNLATLALNKYRSKNEQEYRTLKYVLLNNTITKSEGVLSSEI